MPKVTLSISCVGWQFYFSKGHLKDYINVVQNNYVCNYQEKKNPRKYKYSVSVSIAVVT